MSTHSFHRIQEVSVKANDYSNSATPLSGMYLVLALDEKVDVSLHFHDVNDAINLGAKIERAARELAGRLEAEKTVVTTPLHTQEQQNVRATSANV